jgi:hypothetical protein
MTTEKVKTPSKRSPAVPARGDRRQDNRLTKSGRLTTEEVEKAAAKVEAEKARSRDK